MLFRSSIKPQHAVQRLYELTKNKDTYVTTEVGQHQMWISQHWKFEKPNTWLNSGGLGTMGYALPAAIGAKAAYPDKLVLALDGDGCFQMTCQELITASTENIPLKIVVFNNGNHGMVRQWQQLFFDKRYASTEMINPDFVTIAKGYYIDSERVKNRKDLKPAVERMIKSKKPYVLEVCVEKEDNVFPMIPSGASVSDIRLD